MGEHATDHSQLAALTVELDALVAERDRAEASWLDLAELLE